MIAKVLPLRLCTTFTPNRESTDPYVHCPRRNETIDARECAGCMRMRSLEWTPTGGGTVTCLFSREPTADPRADFAETAARTKIEELIAPLTLCVTPDVDLARVKELFAEPHTRAAAVVDEDGKLQGLVSRSDVMHAAPGDALADVMTKRVHALPSDAPVSYAVSLMAIEDISEVPIVTSDGKVIGICFALDIMRWVAARLGYTVPNPANVARAEGASR